MDALERIGIARDIAGRRRRGGQFGVERRRIGGPPLLIHRLEPRRAVPDEGGTVAIVGRQIMDERDDVGGEGVAAARRSAPRRASRRWTNPPRCATPRPPPRPPPLPPRHTTAE